MANEYTGQSPHFANQRSKHPATNFLNASARWLIVFFPAVHFPECDVISIGLENGIIPVPLVTPHRPDHLARHHAFEHVIMSIWPRQNQGASKLRQTGVRRIDGL